VWASASAEDRQTFLAEIGHLSAAESLVEPADDDGPADGMDHVDPSEPANDLPAEARPAESGPPPAIAAAMIDPDMQHFLRRRPVGTAVVQPAAGVRAQEPVAA
jgi:hypothetical protein